MAHAANRGMREQVNVSVDSRILLVLRTAAARDGVSVSELLRPEVEKYVRRRLRDEHLAEAVEQIQSSRQREEERRAERRGGARVTSLAREPSGPRRRKAGQKTSSATGPTASG